MRKKLIFIFLRTGLILSFLFMLGCANFSLQDTGNIFHPNTSNKSQFHNISITCDNVPQKDLLLCYMEKGLSFHYKKKYNKSNIFFLKAVELMDKFNKISIREQSSAVFINDKTMTYRGEYSERLWVHTYLMINFLLQYKYEKALVEAKQALKIFDEYPGSLKNDYFTRALIALCFENMHKYSDARIEYEKLSQIIKSKKNLLKICGPDMGELILFVGQGSIPHKISKDIILPPLIRISLPHYTNSYSHLPVYFNYTNKIPIMITTNLGNIAATSLKKRTATLIARHSIRTSTKEVIAKKIGEKSHIAETIFRAISLLSEQADTREWQSLPGSLTMIKLILQPGFHNISLSLGNTSKNLEIKNLEIHAKKKVYRSVRF